MIRRVSMEPKALETLAAVLEAVRASGGYLDLLARITVAVTRVLPCDRAAAYIYSRRRGLFMPVADHGTPPAIAAEFVHRGFTPETFPRAGDLLQGRSVHAIRGACDPYLQDILERAHLQSLLLVPLMFQGASEGVLSLSLERGSEFARAQVDALEQCAPHLALLIHSSRLEAEQSRIAQRRTLLLSCAADLLAEGDVHAIGQRLCETARALFRTTRAGLFLLEEERLVPTAIAGPYGDHVRAGTVHLRPTDEPAFAEVLRTGEVLIVNRFRGSRFANSPLPVPARPQAAIAIPLRDASGVLGVLSASEFDEPDRFAPSDADDARLLGTIATAAVRKALLLGALRLASRAKDEFLASVSHDLRTPLNVLIGYAQLLRENDFGPLTSEQGDVVLRMERCALGQLGLINDLLDLSRIEQGGFRCTFAPLPVGELVPSLRDLMEALLRGRPIAFEIDVAADAIADTDRERLAQVLINLLGNAAKFTHAGFVRLSARAAGDAIELVVEDSGDGIEAAFAARATEPFVRGDSEAAGSGLGLAIVARLVRLLRGEIRIDSAPGRGTAVHLRLPAVPTARLGRSEPGRLPDPR